MDLNFLKNLTYTHKFWVILLPFILMVCDIITGYTKAKLKKEVKSSKMRAGIGKKIAELVYIIVGVLIGYSFNYKIITYTISIYIVYMELVSIIENCKELGVELPKNKRTGEENDLSNKSK